MRFFMQWLMTFVLLASNAVQAQSTSSATALATRAQTTYGNSDVTFRYSENSTQAIRKDSAGRELVVDMPVSSDAELRKFMPSTMLEQFKAAAKGTHPLAAFKETYQRFPRESFLFFLAIGGVTMFQLATDSTSNPVRMKEHLEHSISPLGMFSFFTFMYANGVTSNFLTGWLKNPRFHSFIPYMGMTAGFFVQSTVSALASDPDVKSCVSQFFGNAPAKDAKACDAAYARYVLKKQLSLAAPGLISMMASTILAGMIQKGIFYGVFKLTGVDMALWMVPGGVGIQAIRFAIMSVVQMAMFYYLDAGWLNRKVTFAWRNVIDGRSLGKLEREIADGIAAKKASGWKRATLTPYLCKLAGQENCEDNLAATLKTFHQEAAEWRQLNLIDTHEAHQAWQTKLAQLSGEYNLAHAFYRDFAEEVRNSRFELSNPLARRLDVIAPLSGVTPKNVTSDKMNLLYSKPAFYEEAARLTAVDVGNWLSSKLSVSPVTDEDLKFFAQIAARLKTGDEKQIRAANQELYAGLRAEREANVVSSRNSIVVTIRRKLRGLDSENPEASRSIVENGKAVGLWLQEQLDLGTFTNRDAQMLLPRDQKFLNDLAEKLKSGDVQTQGRAVLELNAAIDSDLRGTSMTGRLAFLQATSSRLGSPTPYFEKGRGFLAAFETYSDNSAMVKNTSFRTAYGAFKTPRPTDYMLLQMFCGPDADRGEALISSMLGFSATFNAPRVVDLEPTMFCQGPAQRPANAIYRTQIPGPKGTAEGVLEYIKMYARDQIIGDKTKSNLETWWTNKVEPQMKAKYDEYGTEYSGIIANMLKGLNRGSDSMWNAGPFANGTITSARQQMRFDLMLLGEMLKDLYKAQKQQELPAALFSTLPQPTPMSRLSSGDDASEGLLAALRRGGSVPTNVSGIAIPGTIFDWNQLITTYDNSYAKSAAPGRTLQIQKDVETEFEALVAMLNRIKVQPFEIRVKKYGRGGFHDVKGTEDRIVSDLENEDIQNQVKKVGDVLSKLGDMLGAGEGKNPGLVNLSAEERDVAVTALEGLQGLAGELGMLALMANAVSWDKINELKKAKAQAAALDSKINSAEAELGALLAGHESIFDQAEKTTEE